ncbi:unnamed protein product [Adineta steineri]|uniref:Ion transport domain-containing protein n=3 Tax=Adineta steineri TaxID=433720 RepID=A0A818SFX7_9BILA|nr:unnamed protein product [Adineta steineri]CAF3670726.1 unnamed protein product [Adineta steineri]
MEKNSQQRFISQLSPIFRDAIFRSSLDNEMTNLSTILINSAETAVILPDIPKYDICLVSKSSHYVTQLAETGNVQDFEQLIKNDPSKLTVLSPTGLCAVHIAAAQNRVDILTLIVQYHGDLNIEDKNGWTPLHHAIRNNALNAIEFLLEHGVDNARLNKQQNAPIHLAIIHNQLDALKLIISKHPYQVDLPGERKKTPLHYAALIDNVEAAKILTNNHACLCLRSDVGNYPIHEAALNSSNRVFNHLCETAKANDCGAKNLLSYCNAENHRPLHSSVIGGNIEAVEMCLKNGGSIDDQQDDLSTPVHLASSQGSLELLKLMFGCQPELIPKVIRMADVQGMIPLHKAAMGDHVDVIEYLLETGSDIDTRDVSKRTSLLLAALNNSVQAVCYLLSKSASLSYRDDTDRNLLHVTILQNLSIETIGNALFKRDNFRILFDQRDLDGYYPIHYASRDGLVNVLTTLIKHGAEINKKTNQRQSSLHFAAQYGRYNTCRQLLDTAGFKRILNEPDHLGQTPLHLCCQNGHTRVVQLLLHKGAQFTKSFDGDTPLHEAASNGHVSTMHIILQAHAHLINSVNRLGMTPLHCAALAGHVECVDLLLSKSAEFLKNIDDETFFDLAIMKKQKDVCLAIINHERWKEALGLTSIKYLTPLLGLIEHLPDCVPSLFNRCIIRSHADRKHKDFHLIYDFRYINWTDVTVVNGKEDRNPMLPLNMMVKFGRTNHLSHPLCETLLRQKWLSYGFPIYMLNLTFYLIFLFSLSYFVITFPACNHHDTYYARSSLHSCPNKNFISFKQSATVSQTLCIWYIILYCFLNFILETIQLIQDGWDYFSDIENYIQWTLYMSTCLFTFPFLFNQSWHYQWVFGAVGVFTAFLGLLFLLGRFDVYGIYVIMFMEIFKTLLHVLSLFSILIFGFALTFCVMRPFTQDLNPANPQHLFMIVLKTVSMMLGELDYDRTYIESGEEQHFSFINLIMLLLFAVIMPILLMNLLIGLAIGDLMQIQQNARLKRLAMQVQRHTNLERKLPKRLIQCWTQNELIIYLNKSICNRATTMIKQWIAKPINTKDILDVNEEYTPENELFTEMYEQKHRQKIMQNQLDKITDLVKLIVQKMEISTEITTDDRSKCDNHGECKKTPKLRQTINTTCQFSHLRSTAKDNISHHS